MARIAFVIPDMGGGGAERVALWLIDGFLRRGHQVDLVLLRKEGALLELLPPQVRIVDLGVTRLRSAILPLVRYLRRERPDAMTVSMWPLTIAGIVAAKLARTGVAVVTSDHSTLSRQYADNPRALRMLRWTTSLFYPSARAVVTVSQGTADDLHALSGLARGQIEVIYNPVPVQPENAEADRAAEPIWRGSPVRILSVGKLKTEKNFSLLLDSVARLGVELDWRLVILGEGPERGPLEEQVRRLGLTQRVTMPGFVTDPTPYYRTATHFVLSSDFEGLPTVLIEALQAGLSIVSTDCQSGPREIIGSGGGRLVPVGDAAAVAEALLQSIAEPENREAQQRLGAFWSGELAADRYCSALGLLPPSTE